MKKFYFNIIISLCLCSIILAEKIQKIEILGNQRIEKETILDSLILSVGNQFSNEAQSNALKKLYSAGFF
jgi:outer membrane protein insertion porin family